MEKCLIREQGYRFVSACAGPLGTDRNTIRVTLRYDDEQSAVGCSTMIWYVATLIASVFSSRGPAAQGAHRVQEETQFVTARVGESVILRCDVSHPLNGQPYVVEWFKYGIPIPFFINFRFYPPHVDPEYAGRASLHGKTSLRIESVRSDDQGWYECKVLMLEQQDDTFHNGSWVHLTVNAPPTFTDTSPQYVEAKDGGSITLTCTASGNPKPSVSWLRQGSLLISSVKYKVSNGSLTVLSINREDQGPYVCRAFSLQGEAFRTTWLLVQGSPFIISPPDNITVNISQDAFFTCQAEAYPRNLTYTWFWEDDNVFFKNDLKRRVSVLVDGSLIIAQVKPEDAGKYTCVPSNSMGKPPSASAFLTVQYPARVVNMPSVIYVAISLPGFIRCPVDANPPVTLVKWKKDGLPLLIEKYPGWSQMDDGSIHVAEVTEDCLGTYTCMPYNALGSMGWSPVAPLVLKDPPNFSVVPGGEYRQEAGRELVIPCEAEGDPFPNITWRKVGKPSDSKHNVLAQGSLQLKSLTKEDHGEWECVATNVATSITASTHVQVIGTSPHAPTNIHVAASSTWANVSWEASYDGGFLQTFSVWQKRERLGPHDWVSIPVPTDHHWIVVPGLEAETTYQFSVLAQNKLGTGPFSEVVAVKTPVFPTTTPEPLVLLTPPRCLTANRMQQGVLLTWIPPANHTAPLQHYVMEFRLGEQWEILDDSIPAGELELLTRDLIQIMLYMQNNKHSVRWEILDDSIPAGELELLTRDLIQEAWYEFRIMAVMDDMISEPSNVVGVSSTDFVPSPDLVEEHGLTPPLVAGIVATICFLAAAVLFSSVVACFINKQRQKKLKRKKDPHLSITHSRKSMETSSLSGNVCPASLPSKASASSEDSHDQHGKKSPLRPGKKEEFSIYKKTRRAITSKKCKSKHEDEAITPIELISRGPDGRFVIDPNDAQLSIKHRRIEGFPFVEESDLYPEFRQSDEENDDPWPPPPVMAALHPYQFSPVSCHESYLQPPAYSPCFHRPFEGMTIMESSQLQATGQIRGSLHHRALYGYRGPPGDYDPPPPFYVSDSSPLRSVMSSSPFFAEGPFPHPAIPEEMGERDFSQYAVYNFPLPLTVTSTSHPPENWQGLDFTFSSLERPQFIFPPYPSSPHLLPLSALPSSSLPMPTYPAVLQREAPKSPPSLFLSQAKPHGCPPRHFAMQDSNLGQLRHTGHGIPVPVLPFTNPIAHIVPSTFSCLETQWFETTPCFSPRQAHRMDSGMHHVVFQPSRLLPLTQSPLSSQEGSPEVVVRPRPRASIVQPPIPPEVSEITLLPPSTASFSRRSSQSSSPAQGQGRRSSSSCYRSHKPFATSSTGCPTSSHTFGQMPAQSRTEDESLPSEPSPPQMSASGKRRGATGAHLGSERFDVLRYQRVKKTKKLTMNNTNSKSRKKAGVSTSQTQQAYTSQVLQPEEALYLHKKRKPPTLHHPYARFSALLDPRPTREDQIALLASVNDMDLNQATFL